ncbi:MAG: alpha-amylase family glycosyl hydrolase, partial [Petrotogales bacterium]
FNVHFLPELNLKNPEVRKILWKGKNSVIKKWTNLGIDDWRIDCAYDIGFKYCKEITKTLKELGDHNSIGEVWAYPKEWVNDSVLDGVMNYYFTELIGAFIKGEANADTFSQAIENTQRDSGLEGLLKSWNILSTHDTPRLRQIYKDKWKLSVVLQFALPGSPLIYYGEELGITSNGDPYCRQPMPWALANTNNETLSFYKSLVSLFKESPAFKKGKFEKVIVTNNNVLVFLRKTKRIEDMKIIVINPTNENQHYRAIMRESRLMNNFPIIDHFTNKEVKVANSTIVDRIPARSFSIFYPRTEFEGYSPYKRIID